MLTPAEAGAGVCLDGSPPALYYVAAKSAAYNASWVVMLQGGGWCVDEASCAERSRTSLGSTAQLAAKQRSLRVGGILHGLALRNPDFHAFHRVLLHYCDGGSFTGDRDVGALHLRGRAVLDAQLRRLEAMGLSDAERVLFGGFSAGGLGASVHADAVRARLRRVRQFGVLAASGFFWPGAGADAPSSRWSSGPFLQRLYDFHRSGGSLHPNCLMQQPAEGMWRCLYASEAIAAARAPIFVAHSALDTWQLVNVWNENRACAASCFSRCDADEVRRLNRILGTFVDGVRRAVLARAGNGAFVTSCPQHSGAQKLGFSKWAIGGVPLRLALRRWWEAPADAPAEAHAHLPCALRDAPANGSHNCEPSCAKVCKGERPTFGFELPS